QYIAVDHKAIKGNINSTVSSYSGILDCLMAYYASLDEAKNNSFKRSAFSYNSKEGKCPVCKGAGKLKISLDFMDDVWNDCFRCNGRRYNDKTLEIKAKGLDVSEVLQLTVYETYVHFENIVGKKNKSLIDSLNNLIETGLGHLTLAQGVETLSSGEAQRLKLSVKLQEGKGKKTLYMLDEPTTGLFYPDIDKLIEVFNRLADEGHTVMFIEHNPYLISVANQVVEL
ncbi:MAG TPA: hypothetical protein VJ877_08005, partial [Bacteroidales bacterium]|nr:hypothetical protein [Bacteroidales bacterium]